MIKIQTLDRIENVEHIVVPTIFPDGTSQVWHLPEKVRKSQNTKITWNFESESEIMHLASLKSLLKGHCHLHIPFLPYARQDKYLDNNLTFNLRIFTDLLNHLNFDYVTSFDVHNLNLTVKLIENFKNVSAFNIIDNLIKKIEPNYIVFPDSGAQNRYSKNAINMSTIEGYKTRNQSTGEIINLELRNENYNPLIDLNNESHCLIIDDICDGGKTFIEVAKTLNNINDTVKIDLYVSHGIFSKEKQVLFDAGISNIYTTNSLLKNKDGFKV